MVGSYASEFPNGNHVLYSKGSMHPGPVYTLKCVLSVRRNALLHYQKICCAGDYCCDTNMVWPSIHISFAVGGTARGQIGGTRLYSSGIYNSQYSYASPSVLLLYSRVSLAPCSRFSARVLRREHFLQAGAAFGREHSDGNSSRNASRAVTAA